MRRRSSSTGPRPKAVVGLRYGLVVEHGNRQPKLPTGCVARADARRASGQGRPVTDSHLGPEDVASGSGLARPKDAIDDRVPGLSYLEVRDARVIVVVLSRPVTEGHQRAGAH